MHLLLLLFALLLVLLIKDNDYNFVSATAAVTAAVDWGACNNCLTIQIKQTTAAGAVPDCSTLPTVRGATAKRMIIRSQALHDFLFSSNVVTNSFTFHVFDGNDETTEGTWIVPSTGEILWTGGLTGSAYKFAWLNFSSGEPNDFFNEDALSVHWAIAQGFRVIDMTYSYLTTLNSVALCMFEHPVISALKILASGANNNYLLFANVEFTRFQIFPTHLPQMEAFKKCQDLWVTDPNTGEQVQGFLSVFYHDHEWNIVRNMITDPQSDVKFHSSANDFGVWIGANSSTSSVETKWQQTGTLTDETIRILRDDNTCTAQVVCTKGNIPIANAGVAFGINGARANKMVWNTLSNTRLPYVCSWRFQPNASLQVSNTLRKSLTGLDEVAQNVSKVSVFTVRVHQTWRDTPAAAQMCWNSKLTNEAGDTVRGMLGMFVNNDEYAVLQKLMIASRYMDAGNGVPGAQLSGWMIGASANTNWGGTLSDLKPKLKWNVGGKLSVDATPGYPEAVIDSYTVPVYEDNGNCKDEMSCKPINKDDDDDHIFLVYRSDIDESMTFDWGRRRPFVCTFRFPIRIRIHSTTIGEYVPILASLAQRKEFCSKRFIIDVNGRRINGTDQSLYAVQGTAVMTNKVAPFLSDNTGYYGPVFFGPKTTGNLCMWYRRQIKTYEWQDCDMQIPFMCYFVVQRSYSNTPSLFSNTKTKTKTNSKTATESSTPDLSQTETTSISISTSESGTADATESIISTSQSESLSMSLSTSETPSLSFSESQSFSKSAPTDTQSDPSFTHDTLTAGHHVGSDTFSPTHETPTLSDPMPSFSNTLESTNTTNESFTTSMTVSNSDSLSQSEPTETKTIQIFRKYKLPAAIATLQTVTGLATLLSGTSVALTKAKLDSLDILSRCGQAERLEDEEPDFMNSPMSWAIGEPPTSYAKGTAVGNIVAACIGCGILLSVAVIFGLVFKGSWRQGIEIARIPGLLMIPWLILVPSSAEAAFVLLFHASDALSTLIAVGSMCIMFGINMAITVQLGRLVSSGILIIRTLPPAPRNRVVIKLESSDCGRKALRIGTYLFTTRIGWVPFVPITEYLNVVSGKVDPAGKHQSEIASELSKGWGAVFEDYTLPYFPALDAAVAVTLGCCAGVAKGPNLPRATCIIALSCACTAAITHFFVLIYYRPCLVRATQWFVSVGSALTLGSACLSFAFYMGRQFNYQAITEKVMLSQSLVGVLLMLIGVGYTLMVFIDFVDAVLAGEHLRHLEKTTKEQLALYERVNQNNNNSKKQSKQKPELKKSALEEELAILVSAMRPENERISVSTITRIVIPNDVSDSTTSSHTPNVRDLDSVASISSPTTPRRRRNRNQNRMSNGNNNYSDEEDENDDDIDLVNLYLFSPSTAKSANERKREWEEQKKLERLRKQKTRADDEASAKAMIEYTKRKIQDEEEKKAKEEQMLQSQRFTMRNRALSVIGVKKNATTIEQEVEAAHSAERPKQIPEFQNKGVTSLQAKRLQEILNQADEKKRKMDEERYLDILKQHEAKVRKEQGDIERRKQLAERKKSLPTTLDDEEDDDDQEEEECDKLLDEEEQLEVDDILGRL